MSKKIKFQVETKRILEILSSEIYDSPYALLRENIQNAYDAILMRYTLDTVKYSLSDGLIDININNRQIIITDNGIGMDEEVLRHNFWKAGSSGKKTELAKKAGVIGTFGIGAMANFGVCEILRVETREVNSEFTLISYVERNKISLTEECIEFEIITNLRPYGTTIIATLAENYRMNVAKAIDYLYQYTKYLPVKVILNGELISQSDYKLELLKELPEPSEFKDISYSDYSLKVAFKFDNKTGNAMALVNNIVISNTSIDGDMVLVQSYSPLSGLRSNFGLALIPIGNYYKMGGIVNLSILQPTAGREALSRDSLEIVNKIVNIIERAISEKIAQLGIADINVQFINYILRNNRIDLASNIRIQIEPNSERVTLGSLTQQINIGKKFCYYTGSNSSLIQTFASEETNLLIVSQSNPRRQLQMAYIKNSGIPEVPDKAHILKIFVRSELAFEEVAFMLRLNSILKDDYSLTNVEIIFAEISHNVNILVENDTVLKIIFSRSSSVIAPVLECYKTAYEVFNGFVKDFIRLHLYPRITNYVPSSTRDGANALQKILKRNRELFSYESSDLGKLESIMSDFISGEIELSEVIKASRAFINSQAITVQKDQIGQVENEIPDIVDTPVQATHVQEVVPEEYPPMPAISRENVETLMKILTVGKEYPHLNNFTMFLSLSDRVFNTEQEFFLGPHATKVIWGSHRIIYIFTHASYSFTLYYDIELKEPIQNVTAGGCVLATTTIVTKNRIFVPIPHQLVPSFEVKEGTKEFFVRYDTLVS